MFAITGITGQVGGQLANELLDAKLEVRAVLRDKAKAAVWAQRGCEIALASMDNEAALTRAFDGAEAAFVLLPPLFDPTPGFAESRRNVAALAAALEAARPRRVVCLSTIGAQAEPENLLTQLQIMERSLAALPMPVAFLRAAWFMENVVWDIDAARTSGVIPTFLQPADKPVPMVATADVAHLAAQLLQETWEGRRVVELEGPERVTPRRLAAELGQVIGREVVAQPVPRATWESAFKSQGMNNPQPRIRMLDGFNEGWIEFESGPSGSRKGVTSLQTVLRGLV
jgi:uncharacterized protein YbjT (DUF2867 family)